MRSEVKTFFNIGVTALMFAITAAMWSEKCYMLGYYKWEAACLLATIALSIAAVGWLGAAGMHAERTDWQRSYDEHKFRMNPEK